MFTAKRGACAVVRLADGRELAGAVYRLDGFAVDFLRIDFNVDPLGPYEIHAADQVLSIIPISMEEALARSVASTTAPAPRPIVGQSVHYLHPVACSTDEVRSIAAVITGIFQAGDGADICTLTIFEPGQAPCPTPKPIRQGETGGTWRYPPIQPVTK